MFDQALLLLLLAGFASEGQQVTTNAEIKAVIAENQFVVTRYFGDTLAQPDAPEPKVTPTMSAKANHKIYVENLIREIFAPAGPKEVQRALAVSFSENQPRDCKAVSPMNKNGSVDLGVFQMNSKHMDEYADLDFRDCRDNIIAAYRHSRKYGWRRWTVFRNGRYLESLPLYQNETVYTASTTSVAGFTVTSTTSLPQDQIGLVVTQSPNSRR